MPSDANTAAETESTDTAKSDVRNWIRAAAKDRIDAGEPPAVVEAAAAFELTVADQTEALARWSRAQTAATTAIQELDAAAAELDAADARRAAAWKTLIEALAGQPPGQPH